MPVLSLVKMKQSPAGIIINGGWKETLQHYLFFWRDHEMGTLIEIGTLMFFLGDKTP